MDAHRMINRLEIVSDPQHTAAGDYLMGNSGVCVVNKTSGAATQVTLTARATAFMFAWVKDGKGDAATNNITVIPDATTNNTTIDGAASFVISENYGAALFMHTGSEWALVGQGRAVSSTELGYLNGVVAGTRSLSKALVVDGAGAIDALTVTTLTAPTIAGTTAFTGRVTGTDGVTSGTARVFGGLAYSNVAASTAVASTSAETLFDASYSIPANTLKVGTVVKVRYQGIATTTVAGDTLITKLLIGGVGGTALQTSSTTDAVNSDLFAGEETIVVRTAGTSGTFVASGSFTKVEAATGAATRVDVITASTTINTTAAQVVGVSCTWNTTNANSARLDILTVEIY